MESNAAQRPSPEAPPAGPDRQQVLAGLAARLAPTPGPEAARFAAVDDRRVLNETGMLTRRNVLARIFSWIWFRRVGFDERHVKTIRDLARDGDVVYVMNHHSTLDYLYFNYAFLRLGLPLAFVANTITTMLLFRPLWAILLHGLRRLVRYYRHRFAPEERLAYALTRRRAALIFLKRRTLWPWATAEATDDAFFATLLRLQLERVTSHAAKGAANVASLASPNESGTLAARPIHLVPQILIWTIDPKRARKSFWTAVFGDPDAPSRFRKLMNFFLNRRHTFVRLGKPIDLSEFLARHADAASLDVLATHLRTEIHAALSLEERVIRGPVLKRAKQVREEILAAPAVDAQIELLASELKIPKEKLRREVQGYLKEIAADVSMRWIEFMCILLTLVFNRIYKDVVVDPEGLERVREAGRHRPLILLPCHRSHVDYLVISYIFYLNGLVSPHIAAGKNLNFFPIGRIFRRSGAFFLRRSFKDNRPYGFAFREYMTKLMQDGYWIEFFLEGGRSRTGKMLPPKFGMLKNIVDAIKSGAAPDVAFVPVYVGYEQVIEERAFSRELGGEAKKKENLGALLNATKVLWAKYGHLYVNFGEPISCKEALARFEAQQQKRVQQGLGQQSGEILDVDTLFLHRLGYRVTDGINKVAIVTPTSLVALVLLTNSKRGIPYDVLLARVGVMLELAHAKGAVMSRTIDDSQKRHRDAIAQARGILMSSGLFAKRFALGEASPLARARGMAIREAIDEVLARMVKTRRVACHTFEDDERVYVLDPEVRINLDFYKNNIVHLVAPEAILAAAIRGTLVDGVTNVARLMEAAAFLSRTFAHEFIFDPEKGFAFQFAETLARFDESGLIVRSPGEDFSSVQIRVTDTGAATMLLLHRVLVPWVEAYFLIAEAVDSYAAEAPIAEARFIQLAQVLGRRRFQTGDVTCPEASSNVNFQHALDAWDEFGLIERARKGREKTLVAVQDPNDPKRLEDLRKRLRAFFA